MNNDETAAVFRGFLEELGLEDQTLTPTIVELLANDELNEALLQFAWHAAQDGLVLSSEVIRFVVQNIGDRSEIPEGFLRLGD